MAKTHTRIDRLTKRLGDVRPGYCQCPMPPFDWDRAIANVCRVDADGNRVTPDGPRICPDCGLPIYRGPAFDWDAAIGHQPAPDPDDDAQ